MKIKFDIEKAKKGAKVVTGNGYPVRIICYDRKADYPIVALAKIDSGNEIILNYRENGMYLFEWQSLDDLFIEVPDMWVNVYKPFEKGIETGKSVYFKKEEAEVVGKIREDYIGSFKLVEE